MLPTLVFLLLSNFVWALDLYKVLDLHPSCTTRDIRHAYKKLSRLYHPDKNSSPDAKDKFVDIAYAYEVLSDDTKREIYDRHGEEGLKQHEQQGGGGGHNPFDIFANFFGGGQRSDQVRRGPTSLTEFEVQLADMYKGASIDFMINKKILCDHCRGTGAASDGDIHTCSGCNGSGIKVVKQQIFPGMYAQSQTTCPDCSGRGKVIRKLCPHCHGAKVVAHTYTLTLEVTAGMPEGHEVVFEGEGDESPDWEPGDVILRVRSRKAKGGYRRKESSLYWKETIGIDEALLGFERNLTHLDGHIVRLRREGVTQPGFVQTLEGEGMPLPENHNLHGDLFVEYNVVLPVELSKATRDKLREAFKISGAGHDEL